jgi:hypothetical protein
MIENEEETIVISKADFERAMRSYFILERRCAIYKQCFTSKFSEPSFVGKIPSEYITRNGKIKWKQLRKRFA